MLVSTHYAGGFVVGEFMPRFVTHIPSFPRPSTSSVGFRRYFGCSIRASTKLGSSTTVMGHCSREVAVTELGTTKTLGPADQARYRTLADRSAEAAFTSTWRKHPVRAVTTALWPRDENERQQPHSGRAARASQAGLGLVLRTVCESGRRCSKRCVYAPVALVVWVTQNEHYAEAPACLTR